MEYDCLVIGGGLSGLAAAIRMAHYERRVLVCERHGRLGGLNSYFERGGLPLETGLHAMTNYQPARGERGAPLMKILRQLRISHDELAPRRQLHSLVNFPGASLRFGNDSAEFAESVAAVFPREIDRFMELDRVVREFNPFDSGAPFVSARGRVGEIIRDPLLLEMLFCPLMYYGGAVKDDMDFPQFVIMFRSVFHEGFWRPGAGARGLLELLRRRLLEAGGEIRTGCGIRAICHRDGRAIGVETAKGEFIAAANVLSCAGHPETIGLVNVGDGGAAAGLPVPAPGELGFVESLFVVPAEFLDDHRFTIMFFNEGGKFHYRNPGVLHDPRSGVLCLPSNFEFVDGDERPPPMVRVTGLSDHRRWAPRGGDEYQGQKSAVERSCLDTAERLLGAGELAGKVILGDLMTPRTITRYTGRINGAIYGAPEKIKDGRTPLENLFLCGADQGFLGIVGAMLSGISIANQSLLK